MIVYNFAKDIKWVDKKALEKRIKELR